MYDTVNFWLDRVMVGVDPLTVAQHLNEATEHNNARGYSVNGKIGNYLVYASDYGINIKGSLPKFLLPSNIHTLTRSTTKEAIQKLSDTLHLPIELAKVTRLDISTVFPVQRPPADYYPFLGNKPHTTRLQATADTLYYNTKKKQLIFYDKLAESKAKKVEVPSGFIGSNLLRMEARFTERLPTQLKVPKVIGSTLFDEAFYITAVKQWGNEYFSIDKLKSYSIMDTTDIKTPKDGVMAILGHLLQREGIEFVDTCISDLRAKKTYPDPKYYTRVKDELMKVLKASTAMEKSDLIKELDEAVKEQLLYIR